MLMKYIFPCFFPVTLGFVETSYSVTENVNATISVCVGVMSGAINETVVVTVSTNDGTAGKVVCMCVCVSHFTPLLQRMIQIIDSYQWR